MARKKGKKHMPVISGQTQVSGFPVTLNGNNGSIITTTGGGSWILQPSNTYQLISNVKDLRSHLFKVEIGDYDAGYVTCLIRSIEFIDEKLVVSFMLDDKDTVREAFSEYHFFRLSYLNTKEETEETYEIKTDPVAETKYILPNVNQNDTSEIPRWKLVWSPYTVTKI